MASQDLTCFYIGTVICCVMAVLIFNIDFPGNSGFREPAPDCPAGPRGPDDHDCENDEHCLSYTFPSIDSSEGFDDQGHGTKRIAGSIIVVTASSISQVKCESHCMARTFSSEDLCRLTEHPAHCLNI